MRSWLGTVVGGALMLLMASCGGDAAQEAETLPEDTTAVVVDSLMVDSLMVGPLVADTLAADTLTAGAMPPDTLTAGATPPDTLTAMLDALRLEIARLNGAVASLERTNALRLEGRDTTAAAAAETFDRLQDAAAEGARQFGMNVLWTLIVLGLSYYVVRMVVWIIETLAERSAKRRLFFKKLIPIVRLSVWGFTIYFVLAVVFDIDEQNLLAASAALGVAVGFAAQDVLKNIFGGILIIFDQPFQVGDKINVGGTYGEVVSIGLRSTRIVTPDDNLVSVPNAQVVDGQVSNANAGALDCQVVVDLYLPGWVDVLKAKSIAYSAAANSKFVYLEKPIVVIVKDVFKETFLTQFKVKAYVLDTRYENRFASDITETAKAEFLREGLLQGVHRVPAPLQPPANGAPPTPSPRDVS